MPFNVPSINHKTTTKRYTETRAFGQDSKGQIKEQTLPFVFLEKNFSTSSMIITYRTSIVRL